MTFVKINKGLREDYDRGPRRGIRRYLAVYFEQTALEVECSWILVTVLSASSCNRSRIENSSTKLAKADLVYPCDS